MKKNTSPSLPCFIKTLTFKILQTTSILLLLVFFVSCSSEDLQDENLSEKPTTVTTSVYKGIFASRESNTRGTLHINMRQVTGSKDDVLEGDLKLTLSNGEEFEAPLSTSKNTRKSAADFKVYFYSEDMEFTFSLDANGLPVLSDVVFKKENGAAVAAPHTAQSPVTPLTGIYKCTNCDDKNSSINGIELNNTERVFNMLLTTKDGETGVSIQAVIGSLINADLTVEQSCSEDAGYTFCNMTSGSKANSSPVQWYGVHRFLSSQSTSNPCSTLTGELLYASPGNGVLELDFSSDNSCQ